MRTNLLPPALLGISLLLSGCGDGGPDIETQIAEKLPESWELTDFEIRAKEAVGTEVSPLFNYRFAGEVAPSSDLYESAGTMQFRNVLYKVYDEDDEFPIHGTASSRLRADNWKTTITYEEDPWRGPTSQQKPRGAWGENTVVIGGPEYIEFKSGLLAEMAKTRQLQAEQQQKLEDYQTQGGEARKKFEEDVARLDEQWAAAQKRYEEVRDALIVQKQELVRSQPGREAIREAGKRTQQLHNENSKKLRAAQKEYYESRAALQETLRENNAEYRKGLLTMRGFVESQSRLYQTAEHNLGVLEHYEKQAAQRKR